LKIFFDLQDQHASCYKHSSNANLPEAGKLSSKVFLTKSSEMINRKYEREISEPWRKQHIGAPAIA